MTTVRFISDLHLGHKQICEFSGKHRGNVKTVEEHDAWIIEQWNSVVSKRDLVIVLGDVAFTKPALALMKKLKGSKHLLKGNHDKWADAVYAPYFDKILGFSKYKGAAWLSHAPIHPQELRGLVNIHGHTHQNVIRIAKTEITDVQDVGHAYKMIERTEFADDHRYFSVCPEALAGKPIAWEEIKKRVNL